MIRQLFRVIVAFFVTVYGLTSAHADVTEPPIYQKEKIGVMVIDVQQYYIPWARDKDMDETIDRIGKVMQLSSEFKLPYFMTFEYATWRPPSEYEDHIKIADKLVPFVPTINSESYLKVCFDSSRQPELDKDLAVSGVEKLVLVGAETDVCVIQTAMGLKRRGYDIYLVKDGVYTSEANERPAFLRMAQAGIKLISTTHFENVLRNNEPLTADLDGFLQANMSDDISIVDPPHTAIILNDFRQSALDKCVNKSMKPMLDRATIMFHESDGYKIPIYSVNNATLSDSFPSNFFRPGKLEEFTRSNTTVTNAITDFDAKLSQRDIYQVFVAGVFNSEELRITVTELLDKGLQVFILQDLIFSEDYHILSQIESLYHQGAIPMTFKMLKYGTAKSVSVYDTFSYQGISDVWAHYGTGAVPWIDALDPVEYYQ